MSRTERVVILLILLTGAILRFYNFWDFSLSNDELSALARLNFSSFSELIMEGVRIDGHPPAAQVLLWYLTNWFGNDVLVVRLPFVLAGVFALFFVYKSAEEWIGNSGAILTAAIFSTLSFPILYSRIARPYAIGMLFVAMATYFWIRIINGKGKTSDHILLALSFALCAYSHYFAALTAAILAMFGCLLVDRNRLKKYLVTLAGSFLLFSPYLPIFKYQLNAGGVGQWLAPPGNDWLLEHVLYAFNESYWLLIVVVVTAILGFVLSKSKPTFKRTMLPIFLFLSPFLVGFIYSKFVNPVLQHSTLLFSFPFLLNFLFSGWQKHLENRIPVMATLILLVIGTVSTVVGNRFYTTNHFGVFKELAEHLTKWNEKVNGDATFVGDFNSPFYIDYYLDKSNTVQMVSYRVTDELGLAELKAIVDTSSSKYFAYSWSTISQLAEVQEIIRYKFPVEVERETYFNSEAILFTRGTSEIPTHQFDFGKNINWNCNPEKVVTDSMGNKSIIMDSESPYGPTFMASLDSLKNTGKKELIVMVEVSQLPDTNEIQMVYDQANNAGGYSWQSDMFKQQFVAGSPTWGVFHYNLNYAHDTLGQLKVYPWAPKGEVFELRKMEVILR